MNADTWVTQSLPESAATRLTIRRRLIALVRSYVVTDSDGAARFKITGKLRFARIFSVNDDARQVVYLAREKLLALDPTFVILKEGVEMATVKRTSSSLSTNDRFEVSLSTGEKLHASGRLWQEGGMTVSDERGRVAMIYRHQRSWRETFTFDAADDDRRALLLAAAMCIVESYRHRGAIDSGS